MRTSPSALSKFFTCPAQYTYSRKYRPIETADWLGLGLQVHAMMEGEKIENPEYRAIKLAGELKRMRDVMEYEILEQEAYQIVPFRGHEIDRRIDAIAKRKDKYVLIDWKTAGKEWTYYEKGGQLVAPKGAGFQAAAYLIPPEEHNLPAWPDEIHFIVAPLSGNPRIFIYERNPEDEDNLEQAILMLAEYKKHGIMVKNKGFVCAYCDFDAVCYDLPGWQEYYEERKDHDG